MGAKEQVLAKTAQRHDESPRLRSVAQAQARPQAGDLRAARATLREIEARDSRYRRALAVADLVAAAGAVLLASLPFARPVPAVWALAIGLVVLLGKVQGAYDRDELLLRKTTLDQAPQLLQATSLTLLGLWLVEDGTVTRAQHLVLAAALFAGTLAARSAARAAVARVVPAERCLFVGDAPECERLRGRLRSRAVHAELVGRIALRGGGDPASAPGDLVMLRELIAETAAHRLVIEPQALPPDDMLDVIRAAKSLGMRVSLLPRILDVVGSSVVFDDLEGMTVLGVRSFGLSRSSQLVKRGFDVVVAALALLAAAPLLAAITLAIVLDSGRPVLFRQLRVGRDGRRFLILKFRTMHVDAEARHRELRRRHGLEGELFKLERDPRVTRVGRLLRSSSLDELPQLFNVLRGEMSLVGPRPLMLDEDAHITGWDRRRLYLTPGMTGSWQIAGSGRVPLPEMVKIDYLYVAGWSLWLDVKILLRTIPHVVLRRGM